MQHKLEKGCKLSVERGMAEDNLLSHSKLLDISAARAKIVVNYWNRWELLNKFFNKRLDKTFTGEEVLSIIQQIENDVPNIIGGNEDIT